MDAVVLDLPFTGRWIVQNSPARRFPSHGTTLMGTSYAIDFVGVDERRRTAPLRDWRTYLATEPPERFYAYGRPIRAPCDGTVVAVHDGEVDHEARRSQLALVPYALGQAARIRQGPAAIAGNHVTLRYGAVFVTLVHLRRGSLLVDVGDAVTAGQQVAECGNSGNSTEPHVHVQANDSADIATARAVPLAFRDYREWPRGGGEAYVDRTLGVPAEASVVAPVPG
ncbi:M23 family metallopeptidase [Mumia sp. zg.B53]|uniref:M23 family metallopeptidase n=1 Tax=Mumia sp. zg.B53 TaxID=2855449 RepID=UPI001C6ECEB3|nr:M23 family metallopeptidase [Mumia sp. zg.B53]MBW9215458.1 M23 family metallopeptidase [Mumia sp. zg.B53]